MTQADVDLLIGGLIATAAALFTWSAVASTKVEDKADCAFGAVMLGFCAFIILMGGLLAMKR